MNSHKTNIVVFGRSGSGKSSLINKLAKKKASKEGSTFVSETAVTNVLDFDLHGHSVCLFDTPGFADNRPNFSNASIMKNVLETLQEHTNCINLILYCMSGLNQRVDPSDVHELKLLGTIFGESIYDHVVIVMTQIDRLSEDEQARSHKRYKGLLHTQVLGVQPHGLLFGDFKNFHKFASSVASILDEVGDYPIDCNKALQLVNYYIKNKVSVPTLQQSLTSQNRRVQTEFDAMEGTSVDFIPKFSDSLGKKALTTIKKLSDKVDMLYVMLESKIHRKKKSKSTKPRSDDTSTDSSSEDEE